MPTSLVLAVLATILGCEPPLGGAASPTPDAGAPDAGAPAAAAPVKIAPPGRGGIYLGQNQYFVDDIALLERAAGRKAALFYREIPMHGGESEPPSFDVEAAARAWADGYLVLAHAYEATPGPDRAGFTVDRLLAGEYDGDLERLAAQFRAFGRPLIFTTAREPNGILRNTMGGFGPAGDRTFDEAAAGGFGLAEFDPSALPHAARLYADLGDPEVCDGVERLVAAQRYYHDFFVGQRGLDFLTFDSMGWLARSGFQLEGHAGRLSRSCDDFASFYPGDAWVDWVSINYYQPAHDPDVGEVPVEEPLRWFRELMQTVRRVAPGKPVLLTEFGSPLPTRDVDSEASAIRMQAALQQLLDDYPEVGGLAFWSRALTGDPTTELDTLVRPGTAQARALRAILDADPDRFASCARFTDGSTIPGCDPLALSPTIGTGDGARGADGEPCEVAGETGVWCSEAAACSTGEVVDGCCIEGSCG